MALRSFYRLVAIGSLYTLGVIAALVVLAYICRYDTTKAIDTWPLVILAPPALIGSFFAIGITVLWFGMILDCTFTRDMSIWAKVIWLVVLVLTGTIGALIYYFYVYKNRATQTPLAEVNLPTQV
jgi:Phospholipase_D-nuclease N-terminal